MTILAADWLGLHWLDWTVLALYFVVILIIGLWSVKRVKDMSDFFMGGRRFGKVFMMFFAFGSGTSSEQAISVVAGSWRAGLAGIWWQFLWLWATPFYWLIAPVMRRMRALTTADFFEARYDTSTATLYSIYGIIISIVFIAGGLFSSGKMIDALTGGQLDEMAQRLNVDVPTFGFNTETKSYEVGERPLEGYEIAILAMTVLFVIYGMAGGLGAAIITDFIQGILTVTFSFLLLPFVFGKIGGFGALHSQGDVKQGMLDIVASPEVARTLGAEPITPFYVVMLSVTALAGIVVQPHIMGVCGAGKTEYEGRFGFTFGNFMKRLCTIAWTFTGLACIVWYLGAESPLRTSEDPQDQALYQSLVTRVSTDYAELSEEEREEIDRTDVEFADRLFGKAAYDILPTIAPGLVGLLLASLLAAVMSTSDAQMIISSGIFTENIYKRFVVKSASQRHYLWVGRIAGLIIVALALMLQGSFTGVIDALKTIIKTPAAIGISLWVGIIWRGWTPIAVWVSTIVAAATWWLVANRPDLVYSVGAPDALFLFNAEGEMQKMSDGFQMLSYLSVGILSGFAVSLFTPRTPEEKLDHFYDLLHTPVKPDEHIEQPCTLPDDPLPKAEKLFNYDDIEISKPTLVGFGGFVISWICVAALIWLVQYLARTW